MRIYPFDDWEDIRGDSDSLAGLVLEISGRFPKTGDVIRKKNYSFAILEMDKMRITKIKLTIHPAEEQTS
ncbi:MAG: transporter associated domain-containing protein [Chitinophagaceae bacterium]